MSAQQQTHKMDSDDDGPHNDIVSIEGHSAYGSCRGGLPLGRRAQRRTRFPLGPETTLEKSSAINLIVKRNVDHVTDTGSSSSRPSVLLPSELAGASFTEHIGFNCFSGFGRTRARTFRHGF